MKLQRFKENRIEEVKALLSGLTMIIYPYRCPEGVVWVCFTPIEYLERIYDHLSSIYHGYRDCYTFGSDKFLSYEEVFEKEVRE